MELKKRKIIIVVLLALTLFVSLPVLTQYLVPGLDLKFHLYRIEGIVAGLKTGQIPVRMQPEWLSGYGYPVSIFYSDFFLYWPAFFRILHVNLQDCYKIYVITVNLLTIYLAFKSFKGIFKDDTLIGVIGSVLWSTSIYRLGCEYARAGVGEYTALAFVPLFFWGGYQILYQPNKKNSWCITGVGFACLALSHILTAEIATIFIVILALVNYKKILKKDYCIPILKSIVLGLFLILWFLVPFLTILGQMKFQFQNNDDLWLIQNQGASLLQLLSPFNRGNGMISSVDIASGMSMTKELPYSIGLVGWCIIFAFIVLWIWNGKSLRISNTRKVFGVLLLLLYMVTYYFPWDFLTEHMGVFASAICILQFPWRILGFANFLIIIIAGNVILELKENYSQYMVPYLCILLCFSLIGAGMFIVDRDFGTDYWNILSKDDLNSMDIMGAEYVPLGLNLTMLDTQNIRHSNKVTIDDQSRYYTNFTLTCRNSGKIEELITLPLMFYPYYKAQSLSGEVLQIQLVENGLLGVVLPAGFKDQIMISIKEPLFFSVSTIISAFAWLLCFGMLYKYWNNSKGFSKC